MRESAVAHNTTVAQTVLPSAWGNAFLPGYAEHGLAAEMATEQRPVPSQGRIEAPKSKTARNTARLFSDRLGPVREPGER